MKVYIRGHELITGIVGFSAQLDDPRSDYQVVKVEGVKASFNEDAFVFYWYNRDGWGNYVARYRLFIAKDIAKAVRKLHRSCPDFFRYGPFPKVFPYIHLSHKTGRGKEYRKVTVEDDGTYYHPPLKLRVANDSKEKGD